MNEYERDLMRRLLEQVRHAGTPEKPERPGHLAIKVGSEMFGVCNQRVRYVNHVVSGICAPSCIAWRALVDETETYLAAPAEQQWQVA